MTYVRNNQHARIAITSANDSSVISTPKLAALPASIVSRAFSIFEGSGLNLAIISKVMADHVGTLTVDSVLGTGTRYIIGIPGY